MTDKNGAQVAADKEAAIDLLIAQDIADAWAWMLSDERGKLILWSVLDKCGLQNFSFQGNSHDALLKGRQQVGAEILVDHVYPMGMKYYTDMLLEAEERRIQLETAQQEADNAALSDAGLEENTNAN